MPEPPVYLDHNATTAVDPLVLEKMLPYFKVKFGNPASKTHAFGWVAEEAVKMAREQVAGLLGAEPGEVIFTSGATEAVNLALKGYYEIHQGRGRHIISVQTEHPAVLDTLAYLESRGARITLLPVDREGLLDPRQLERAISPETIIICVMAANNETGVMQPLDWIGELAQTRGILFFCDATQAAGKSRLAVNEMKAGMLCLSAHKLYGPKGTGALVVKRRQPKVNLMPLIHGGGHELGLRSGTLNVPGIVGMGEACRLATAGWWDHMALLSGWRTSFEQQVMKAGDVFINGSTRYRLPNTSNLLIRGVLAADLIRNLPELAFSAGSACSSARPSPSPVLTAMGLTRSEAGCSVRFSLGKDNTREEIQTAATLVETAIRKIRGEAG